MNVAAAGLTPMSPVMADVGTVEMPAFARMAKPAALPRSGAVELPGSGGPHALESVRTSMRTSVRTSVAAADPADAANAADAVSCDFIFASCAMGGAAF